MLINANTQGINKRKGLNISIFSSVSCLEIIILHGKSQNSKFPDLRRKCFEPVKDYSDLHKKNRNERIYPNFMTKSYK